MLNLHHIRLVGLDLDETVFTHDKRITGRTRAAIQDAIGRGILVMPATGRPVTGIPESFAKLAGVRYLLGSNGAAVYDQLENRWVVHDCMDRETVLKIMDVYRDADCSLELYLDGIPYVSAADLARADYFVPNPFVREYVRRTRVPVASLRDFWLGETRGAEKINLCFPTESAKEYGMSLLPGLPEVTGVCGLPTNLELARRGVDKGEGLLKLAALLGLPREAVLACGDSGNDLAMIQKAGIGAAVANASDSVKEAADWVLPYTNEEEGVAWMLEEIIKAVDAQNGTEAK